MNPIGKKAQAKVRALKAQLSRPVYGVSEKEKARRFRSGFLEVVACVREDAVDHAVERSFSAAWQLFDLERRRFSRQPIGYSNVVHYFPFEPLPIGLELQWAACSLLAQVEDLREHVQIRDTVSSCVLHGRITDAVELVKSHEEAFGVTFWSLQVALALRSVTDGSGAARELSKQVRKITGRSMATFVANLQALRLDPSASLTYFESFAEKRIERISNGALRCFLRSLFFSKRLQGDSDQAGALCISQGFSAVDQFELACQVVSSGAGLSRLRRGDFASKELLDVLCRVDEKRFGKITRSLDGRLAEPSVAHEAFSEIVRGHLSAARTAIDLAKFGEYTSVTCLLADAVLTCLTSDANPELKAPDNLVGNVASFLVGVLRRQVVEKRPVQAYDLDLRKLAIAFSALPAFRAINRVVDALSASDVNGLLEELAAFSISESESSPFDVLIGRHTVGALIPEKNASSMTTMESALESLCFDPSRLSSLRLHADALALFSSFGYLLSAQDSEAEQFTDQAVRSGFRLVRGLASIPALTLWAEAGEFESVCRLVVEECCYHGAEPRLFPMAKAMQSLDHKSIRKSDSAVDILIALSLLSKVAKDHRALALRTFALERILVSAGVSRPSELRADNLGIDAKRFEWLLGRACTPEVIDMLPSIESSKAVLEERAKICSILMSLPECQRREDYQDELLRTTKILTIERGIRVIDGSRVHVDESGVKILLREDLAEGFARYVELLQHADAEPESFEEAFRFAMNPASVETMSLGMSDSEADELLIAMVLRAREHFLFDPRFGLDCSLSKRIRHGSIVGYLRNPSASLGLAPPILTGGQYGESTLLDSLSGVSPSDRAVVRPALIAYAKTIDDLLLRLKDQLLHVKSNTHPHGIFDAPLSLGPMRVIRSVAAMDNSLDAFVETLVRSLQALIVPSLNRATELVAVETRKGIKAALDRLSHIVATSSASGRVKSHIASAIADARIATDAAIEQCADWFRPGTSSAEVFSDGELVEVAKRVVQSIHPNSELEVHYSSEQSFSISSASLVALSDILFVILDNAVKWGDSAGRIDLSISANFDLGTLDIRSSNLVAENEPVALIKERIEEKKREIARRESSHFTRREGGSGLHKLAATVDSRSEGLVDFGISSDGRFEICVRVKVIDLSLAR